MITLPKFQKSISYAVIYRRIIGVKDSFLINSTAKERYDVLKPTLRYWYADPLLLKKKCNKTKKQTVRNVVYMEVYDRISRKGAIGISEFSTTGKLCRPRILIDEPFHMSFPMTFYYKDELFMIPETNAAGEIRIYKETKEDSWELYYFQKTDYLLVDIVLLPQPGKNEERPSILLLAGEKDQDQRGRVRSSIYQINNLMTPEMITIERKGSVSDFSYEMRNGGRVLEVDGNHYRIRQYSEKNRYGIKVLVDKIQIPLSTEKKVGQASISTKPYYNEDVNCLQMTYEDLAFDRSFIRGEVVGIHTYDMTDDYEVLDVAWRQYNLLDILYTMIHSFCRFWEKRIKK